MHNSRNDIKGNFTRLNANLMRPEMLPLRNVALFVILLLSFHYIYIFWAGSGFYPIQNQVNDLFAWASRILFEQSAWVVNHVFHLTHKTENQTIWVLSNNDQWCWVEVSPGCTSLKQWLHFIFLMIFFPGPWKHKAWFISAGIIIIHFVNLTRVVGLSLILIPWPTKFHFFHDYIFKTFFYLMIFLMWVVWVEFFAKESQSRRGKESKSL